MRKLLLDIGDLIDDYIHNEPEEKHEPLNLYARMKARVLVDILPVLNSSLQDVSFRSSMRESYETGEVIIEFRIKEKE